MNNPEKTANIHHEEPDYYSLTESELDQIKEKARIPERENTYLLIGLFIPSLVNFITEFKGVNTEITWVLNLNLIIVIITFLLMLFQLRGWVAKASGYKSFLTKMKAKPKIEMRMSDGAGQYVKSSTTKNSDK